MLRRYLLICAASFVVTVSAAGLLAVTVDPYGVFRWISREGFNERKVRVSHSQFEVRSRNALRLRADAWILGNSRAEMGFDPQHPGFTHARLTAYNLAVPGFGGTMSLKFAQALAHHEAPRRMIVGVDFLDFPVFPEARQPPLADYQPSPLADTLWLLRTVFSARATLDSMATLAIQNDPYAGYMTTQGFNPMRDYVQEVRRSGAYAMFTQRAQESAKAYAAKPLALEVTRTGTSSDWEALKKLLAVARPGLTEVDIVIYPYHAQLRWLFAEYGLEDLFQQWRERLLHTVETENATRGLTARVWDFSGFTAIHCEPIPPPDDRRTELNWYWEGGHFKKELGDRMLNQLLLDVADEQKPFGVLLDSQTLAAKVLRDRDDELRCRNEIPTVLESARSIAAAQRRRVVDH